MSVSLTMKFGGHSEILRDYSSLEQGVPGCSWVLLRMRTMKSSWDCCPTAIELTEKEQAK